MKIINGSAFRKRMCQHLDECEESSEPLLVRTQKPKYYQEMVVMTKDQYEIMIEQINQHKGGRNE